MADTLAQIVVSGTVVFDFNNPVTYGTKLNDIEIPSPDFDETILHAKSSDGFAQSSASDMRIPITVWWYLTRSTTDLMMSRMDGLNTYLRSGGVFKYLPFGGTNASLRQYTFVRGPRSTLDDGRDRSHFRAMVHHAIGGLRTVILCQPNPTGQLEPLQAPA